MKLIHNAKNVLKYASSIKLLTVAALLEALSTAGPLLLPDIAKLLESKTVSVISMMFIVAGIVARFIKQEKVSG